MNSGSIHQVAVHGGNIDKLQDVLIFSVIVMYICMYIARLVEMVDNIRIDVQNCNNNIGDLDKKRNSEKICYIFIIC